MPGGESGASKPISIKNKPNQIKTIKRQADRVIGL